MPLVEHSDLPTFSRLREQGHDVLSLDRAVHQDIRELHVGFLNMMPDAALEATERQFIRLVGGCNRIAQIYVYPFSLPGLPRSEETLAFIERYYSRFEDLQAQGLDALVITGANVANPQLDQEPFWDPLIDVIRWAEGSVVSTLCSCLATHAMLKYFHGIERQPLPAKRWGVYSHRVSRPRHPLLRDINTRFDVPHSRYNDIPRSTAEAAGLSVLAESPEGGVHMMVSPDQFRMVYFQGHPEYDTNSLLKEFKREVSRYVRDERGRPPVPQNYFANGAGELVTQYLQAADLSRKTGAPVPEALDQELEPLLDNTWGDTGKAIINNWLGLVYQLTNLDRRKLFMDGVDPSDPLRMKQNKPGE